MRLSRREVLAGAAATVAAAAVSAWLLSRRPEGGSPAGRPEHVILVDWDGFDPGYLDAFGHAEGAEGPNIGPLLAELDRQLGRLIQTTKEVGVYEQTAFLLTSDHGMTTWDRSLAEEIGAITVLGQRPEIVVPGRPAPPDAEIIVVASAGRVADVTLRGRAATPEGREGLRSALEGMPQISRVLVAADLKALRASDKLGNFVIEAEVPWGFKLPEPEEGTSRGPTGAAGRCGCRF